MSSQCLFDLLVSLEGETADSLDALELVKAEKPLRSLGKMTGMALGGYKVCINRTFYLETLFRQIILLLIFCRLLLW